MSALCSARSGEDMIREEEEEEITALAILDGDSDTRSDSKQSSYRSAFTTDDAENDNRATSQQSSHRSAFTPDDVENDNRATSQQSSHRSAFTPDDAENDNRAKSQQSSNGADSYRGRQQGSRSRGDLSSRSSAKDSNRHKEHYKRPKSRT